MLTMKRIILFFIFTAIFTVVYGTSAVTSEPTEEEIQEIMDFFDEIVGTIDGIAAANADVAQLNPLAILLTPFGLMEMAAYSIAMSRSTLLAKNVFQKNWELIKNEKLILSIEIGIVIALLLIGGIVEMWMIETAQGMEG